MLRTTLEPAVKQALFLCLKTIQIKRGMQGRTHRILRIAAEDVEFLHKLDANVNMLKAF